MAARISWNKLRDSATPAIWKAIDRPYRTILAPIFTSLRPLLHLVGQRQGAQEVGEVVGQGMKLQPHGVGRETPPLPRCSGRVYSSLKPTHPYQPSPTGWGPLELAARLSWSWMASLLNCTTGGTDAGAPALGLPAGYACAVLRPIAFSA
jgi:hypothetical protein